MSLHLTDNVKEPPDNDWRTTIPPLPCVRGNSVRLCWRPFDPLPLGSDPSGEKPSRRVRQNGQTLFETFVKLTTKYNIYSMLDQYGRNPTSAGTQRQSAKTPNQAAVLEAKSTNSDDSITRLTTMARSGHPLGRGPGRMIGNQQHQGGQNRESGCEAGPLCDEADGRRAS